MWALRFHQSGTLAEARVEDVPKPSPGSGEVLVRVRAAAVNPSDVKNVLGGLLFEPCMMSLAHRGRHVVIAASGKPQVRFDLSDFYHREGRLFGADTLKLTLGSPPSSRPSARGWRRSAKRG